MIDLRSDTLTKPTEEMKIAMYNADLGDDGRTDSSGRTEDPTVFKLENMAAKISGHEASLFCSSGTMANYIAILAHGLKRHDKILTDLHSHLYRSERALFSDQLIALAPHFYRMKLDGTPDTQSIRESLSNENIKLLSFENTHNSYGGTCVSEEQTIKICETAHSFNVPVHLDGARIFNAARYLNVDIKSLTSAADSMMFCLSKGLGSPMGSMLCGSHDFINEARKIRKLLGGSLRQAGVIAAAGLVALEKNIDRLDIDHENTLYLARAIDNEMFRVDMSAVQTNIINIDISSTDYTAPVFQNKLEYDGLKVNAISDSIIRMVVHKDISKENIEDAARIINNYVS